MNNDRRDAALPDGSTRTLAMFVNQQPSGKVVAGSAGKKEYGESACRCPPGTCALGGKTAPNGRREVGNAILHRHELGIGNERGRHEH